VDTSHGGSCKKVGAARLYEGGQEAVYLGTEDAEDLTAVALIKLIKCPQAHRHEKPYVTRLIVNAIITEWRKKLLRYGIEQTLGLPCTVNLMSEHQGGRGQHGGMHGSVDLWDRLESSEDLERDSMRKFDAAKMVDFVSLLPESERIVLELNFGLNGCQPCGEDRIAKKLGRTKWWVTVRLKAGIERIRQDVQGIPPKTLPTKALPEFV
jgi:RNA polymerase sigma factor (sigma-70 family)